ncbi:dihydrofolate reductase family protein [Arthrobacter gengyunqii]|uniref:Dihydrofolate reductase family protein n=1 Tax=Arthrobacter gengyunqii TaxID=2886940 RepID=A0ABS8GLR8_9MICC|nr:dihydrofolate reductase family protein [Arthrobacter gengyunqii]MCC3267624.1 dihydrofolate reductase family protein [Arthrobacter gengyunqii]
MGRLVYSGITSLDGYVADEDGQFDWSAPDEEVHAFVNDLERSIGTALYGRALYEVMAVWDTMALADEPEVIRDYAGIWKATDKIVFSRSLPGVDTTNTRLERSFDPDAVRRLKVGSVRPLSVGGAMLAAQALRAGLVDELHQLLSPVVVGGGKPFLPDGLRLDLELLDERRFGNGVVFLRYGVTQQPGSGR